MKVKCSGCNVEDRGQYKKLVKRGWKIFFLREGIKIIRCKKCKPNYKDKIKKTLDKNYKSEMYHEIGGILNKFKVLKGLKTKEELIKERQGRILKKIRRYKYQRNIKNHSKKEGSKNMGFPSLSGVAI